MSVLATILDRYQEKRLTKAVLPYTLVSPERIQSLCRLARRIEEEHIPGDVMECGVCNGGTAAVLARFATRKTTALALWVARPNRMSGKRSETYRKLNRS